MTQVHGIGSRAVKREVRPAFTEESLARIDISGVDHLVPPKILVFNPAPLHQYRALKRILMLIFLKVLVAVSLLILIIGLIKPKWVLFWMKQPDRLTVTALAMLLFIISWTAIAKLTLKPRERGAMDRSAEESNELRLERNR
jgi:hypothetical protein